MKCNHILRILFAIVLCLMLITPSLADVLKLPSGTKTIEEYAFYGDKSLDEVVLPDGIETIGDYAFAESGLKKINLPESLESIADHALDHGKGIEVTAQEETEAYTWAVNNGFIVEPVDPFVYVPNSDIYDMGCTLVSYQGTDAVVEIPRKSPDNRYVTRIGDSVFQGNTTIETVLVSGFLKEIGPNAFRDCENLRRINRADYNDEEEAEGLIGQAYYVEKIDDYAFYNCSSLKVDLSYAKEIGEHALGGIGQAFAYIDSDGAKAISRIGMPFSVSSISHEPKHFDMMYLFDEDGEVSGLRLEDVDNDVTYLDMPREATEVNLHAFDGCTALKSFYMTYESDYFTVGNGALIAKDGNKLITVPTLKNNTQEFTYQVPNGVEEILPYVFANCAYLTNLTFPDSLTAIDDHAFENCTALTRIRFKRSVESIGASAFSGCTALTEIWLPDTMKTIAGDAFTGCSALQKIYIPEKSTVWDLLDGYGYSGNLKHWDGLCDYSFVYEENEDGTCTLISYNGNSENVVIPYVSNTGFLITAIGPYVFGRANESIISVSIADSIKEIQDSAFGYCLRLQSVKLPKHLKTIGPSAFNTCINLRSIRIPKTVESIGAYAFYNTGIDQITIPKAWKEVTEGSTDGYPSGTYQYTSPFSLMQHEIFRLPDEWTYIPVYAFDYCNIDAIYIPESVKFEGAYSAPFRYSTVRKIYGAAGSDAETWANVHNISFTTEPWPYDDTDPHTVIKHVDEVLYDSDDGGTSFGMRFGAAASEGDVYTLRIETEGAWTARSNSSWVSIDEDQQSGRGTGTVVLHVNDQVTYEAMTGSVTIIAGGETITGNIQKGEWEPGLQTSVRGTVYELTGTVSSGEELNTEDVVKQPLAGVTVQILSRDDLGYYSIRIDNPVTDADGTWSSAKIIASRPYVISYQKDGYEFSEAYDYYFTAREGVNTVPNAYGIPEENEELGLLFDNADGLANVIVVKIGDFTATQNADGTYTTTKYNGNETTLTIPNSVSIIGEGTFKDTNVRNVKIPSNVKKIGKKAFQYCYRLSSITIPASVTYIGQDAFECCTSLTTVEIKGSPDLDENAFAGCSSLHTVKVDQCLPHIGFGAFGSCYALKQAPLKEGTLTIGEYAFSYCHSLTNVDVPSSVTAIKDGAFSKCNNLKAVTVPISVITFGLGVFDQDSALEKIFVTENTAPYTALQQEGLSGKLVVGQHPDNIIEKLTLTHGLFTEFFVYDQWFSGRPDSFMTPDNKRAEAVFSNADCYWNPVIKTYKDQATDFGNISVDHHALESRYFNGQAQGSRPEGTVLYVPEKFGVKMNGYLQIDPAQMDSNDNGIVAVRVRGDNGVMFSLQKQNSNESAVTGEDWDADSDNVATGSRRIDVGKVYALEINLYSNGGAAKLILEYNPAAEGSADYDNAWRTVPTDWLYCGKRQVSITGKTELQTIYAMRMDNTTEKIKNYMHETWKEVLEDLIYHSIGIENIDTYVSDILGIGNNYVNGIDSSLAPVRQRVFNRFKLACKDRLVKTLCKIFTWKLSGDFEEGTFFDHVWDIIAAELDTTKEEIVPKNFIGLGSELEMYLMVRNFLETLQEEHRSTVELDLITTLLSFGDYDHRHEGYSMNPDATVATLLFIDKNEREQNEEMELLLAGDKDAEKLVDFAEKAFKLIKDLENDADRAAATLNLLYAENGIRWYAGLVELTGRYSSGDIGGLSAFERMLGIYLRANNANDELKELLGGHLPYLTGKQCAQILAADQNVGLDHLLYKELLLLTLDAVKGVYKSIPD